MRDLHPSTHPDHHHHRQRDETLHTPQHDTPRCMDKYTLSCIMQQSSTDFHTAASQDAPNSSGLGNMCQVEGSGFTNPIPQTLSLCQVPFQVVLAAVSFLSAPPCCPQQQHQHAFLLTRPPGRLHKQPWEWTWLVCQAWSWWVYPCRLKLSAHQVVCPSGPGSVPSGPTQHTRQ